MQFNKWTKGSYYLSYSAKLFVLVLFLYSCDTKEEPVTPNQPTPSPPSPNAPLPTTPCATGLVDGYTDKTSYFPGEEMFIFLKGNTSEPSCRLNIYSVDGELALPIPSSIFKQEVNPNMPYSNGFGYVFSAKLILPNMKSGVYLIENRIPFIVKSADPVDVVVVYPSNTANAYSISGGKSLYSTDNQPNEVSFHRPIELQDLSKVCLKWFKTVSDVSFSYISDRDLDQYSSIEKTSVLCLVGHNEYWTRSARKNFDRFVDEGGHALILSGNTMWWQVRYSDDGTKLICYKDANEDPELNPLFKTITWDKASLEYPIISSIGADFNRGGYGLRADAGWNGFKVMRPESPLFEGLNLTAGTILSCPSLEYDGAPLLGFDAKGNPILDLNTLGFYKGEILAFDKGFRAQETYATFAVFQRTANSGIIINAGTTDWCSSNGMGGTSSDKIKAITKNALLKLVYNEAVFAP